MTERTPQFSGFAVVLPHVRRFEDLVVSVDVQPTAQPGPLVDRTTPWPHGCIPWSWATPGAPGTLITQQCLIKRRDGRRVVAHITPSPDTLLALRATLPNHPNLEIGFVVVEHADGEVAVVTAASLAGPFPPDTDVVTTIGPDPSWLAIVDARTLPDHDGPPRVSEPDPFLP